MALEEVVKATNEELQVEPGWRQEKESKHEQELCLDALRLEINIQVAFFSCRV